MKKRTSAWALSAGVLVAACGGGGLLALLPYVAAIGGFWTSIEPSDPDATLNFTFSDPNSQNNLFGSATETYPAQLSNSLSTACGAANANLDLVAKFDGQNFTLSLPNAATSCLSGTMPDDVTIVLATGGAGTRFRNQLALQPQFDQGVWTNIDRTSQRLKFRADAAVNGGVTTQTGCEFGGNAQTGSVVITWRPGDPASGTSPIIDSIVITRSAGTETWTQGSMFGVSGVKINAGSATVSLERRNESLAC